jgi:hypothetical protein
LGPIRDEAIIPGPAAAAMRSARRFSSASTAGNRLIALLALGFTLM